MGFGVMARWEKLREVVKLAAEKSPNGWAIQPATLDDPDSAAIRCEGRCPIEVAGGVPVNNHLYGAQLLGLTKTETDCLTVAADGNPQALLYPVPEVQDLRQYMLDTMKIGLVLLLALLPGMVQAQTLDPYNPYNLPPIQQAPPGWSPYVPVPMPFDPVYPVAHRYGNVFIGQSGDNDFQSYLTIATDEGQSARVTIKGAGEPFTLTVYVPAGARGPQDNGQPLYLNVLPQLQGLTGAISVKVELERPAEVSIGMHPKSNFWKGVIFAVETK